MQSGGQEPVPKQLFGSLIYSVGHLVQPLTAKLRHSRSQFRNIEGREDVTGQSVSHLLQTLNLQLRKRLVRASNVTSHEPNCALFHPWLPPMDYLELSFYTELLVN